MISRLSCLLILVVFVTAFFVRPSAAESVPCFDLKIAEQSLSNNFDERLIGVGVTFNGDLMKLFVSSGGRWTIGVVPAGRDGLLCPVSHGDGFRSEKSPGTKPGPRRKPQSLQPMNLVGHRNLEYGLPAESD